MGKGFRERLVLNREILDNPYWCWDVDDKGHENFMPVGRGLPTSSHCGRWMSFLVCDDVGTHKGVVLKGVDYSGKLAVAHEHMWCNRSSCSVCFIRGWSLRGARSYTGRLSVVSELGYGEAEHIMVSVARRDFDLLEEVLREKCRTALVVRGVLGGLMIFHGFRMDRERGVLVWSPHYHSLSFIGGGFDVCRNCSHVRGDCASCGGFKGREVREYAKDGYLVKVGDKRETVFGTIFYQLNHSTIRVGFKRFHVATWFGVAGNRKLKGKKVKAVHVCPVCAVVGVHNEMIPKIYRGDNVIARSVGDPAYKKLFAMDVLKADGSPMFGDSVGSVRFE